MFVLTTTSMNRYTVVIFLPTPNEYAVHWTIDRAKKTTFVPKPNDYTLIEEVKTWAKVTEIIAAYAAEPCAIAYCDNARGTKLIHI